MKHSLPEPVFVTTALEPDISPGNIGGLAGKPHAAHVDKSNIGRTWLALETERGLSAAPRG